MSEGTQPLLARTVLDRDAATRMDEALLDSAWGESSTLLLRVREGKLPTMLDSDGNTQLELIAASGGRDERHFYLGRCDGVAMFARLVDETDEQPEPASGWRHPFSVGEKLSPLHRELMTVAFALINWHHSTPFSPRDGKPTTVAQGGWARIDERGGEHFPRTDPAVIVLVEHDDRLLLGSNVLWETGRFSLLAGFVEAGESAEQAVVREIFEESGLEVNQVRYVASQPWPFPRSLMLGFRAGLPATADPEALSPDTTEISELRWFTRAELRNPAPGLILPRSLSIARWLIDRWIEEGDSAG